MDDPVFVAVNTEGVFVIDLDDVVRAFEKPNLSSKNQPKNSLVSLGKLYHDYYDVYITDKTYGLLIRIINIAKTVIIFKLHQFWQTCKQITHHS